jgi:hypothetical protein
MKKLTYFAFSLATLVGMAHHAFAADVRVIHGINGKDLGLAQELPVDISVNGTCALKGVKFKQSTKVELGTGEYTVRVFLATGGCEGTAVIKKKITISAQAQKESFSLIASLSGKGTPQLAVFQNTGTNFITTGISIRHLAKAGAVKVRVGLSEQGVRIPSLLQTIRNGAESTSFIPGSTSLRYSGTLATGSAKRIILSGFIRRSYRILYLVGSSENGFSVISETIKLPLQ